MKAIYEEFSVRRVITETKVAVKKEQSIVAEDRSQRFIDVLVRKYTAEDEMINEEPFVVNGDKYELLYSLDDIFSDGKTEGNWRKEDLWVVLELMENERREQGREFER